MLEIIKTRDNHKVIEAMIESQSKSVWSGERYDKDKLNFDEAIEILNPDCDFRMPVIRVEKFLDEMLDIDDDFAQEVNEILYSLGKDDSDKVIEILQGKYNNQIDENGDLCHNGYTYNFDNSLSRDIVYHIFEYEGDRYTFIQVHYGADARVGFGSMVCFKIKDIDYFFLGMNLTAYDSVTDEDLDINELSDIADYNIETDTWVHKETGHEIWLHTPANGW